MDLTLIKPQPDFKRKAKKLFLTRLRYASTAKNRGSLSFIIFE